MLAKLIILFFLFASLIIFFTRKLAHSGKLFSDITGLSGGLIGFTLLAVITSMPEVAMSISSVLVVKDPNLCAGDIFGSNLFNLTIIAFVELFVSKGAFLKNLKRSNIKLVLFQLFFMSIPISFMILGKDILFLRLSLCSVLILVVYGCLMKFFNFDDAESEQPKKNESSLVLVIFKLLLFSLIIILSSVFITKICDQISHLTGVGNSFMGALLLATVSSLPEITLSISLVQMGAFSMAVGNILGSNFFNILILAITDLFLKESIYLSFDKLHIIPFIAACLISLIVIFSMQKTKRIAMFSSFVILFVYIQGMYFLFVFSGS